MPIDHGNDIILLTCANGKPCNQLIPFLLPKRKRLRLAVSNDSSRQQLLEKYAGESKAQIEVVLADLTQPDDCKRILEGITAVYHVKPTFHPRETKIGSNIPLLTLSVLHPCLRKLLIHVCKRYVEEALIESGLPYTILQPSNFIDPFPIREILSDERPVYRALWNPDVPFCYTSLYDLAEASSAILDRREDHFYATYRMVSTSPPMDYGGVCKIVSKVVGKDIKVEKMPFQKTMERD
ncbi:hypothetical protein HO173_002592 [Letharia columbiana]|uniref:NAD(P)-binding protein n=1 Tax=Letharia columbiana TaxID=112416 RepID=A0A8H6G2G5_9LECA|nr:uncharacterized protein HO173_002592 [Letharia columbiana]KAF6239330.1 hypothetical protein HO173_002592 [Letharia columbiana]